MQKLLSAFESEYKKEYLMKLFGFRLLVSDFSASVNFWRDIMGLTMSYGDEAIGYAYFDTGGAALELFRRDDHAAALGEVTPTPKPSGHSGVITFKVDDVDTTYAELVKRGATSVTNPKDRPEWYARTAHLSDPDGYLIEIYTSLGANETPTA